MNHNDAILELHKFFCAIQMYGTIQDTHDTSLETINFTDVTSVAKLLYNQVLRIIKIAVKSDIKSLR